MKITTKLLAVVVVATQLAIPLRGDDKDPLKEKDRTKDTTKPAVTDTTRVDERTRTYDDRTDAFGNRAEPFGVVSKAKGVMGLEVRNNQDEKLGKVDDIAMSFSSGRVVAVMVSVGGLLGVGDTIIAVPPSEFQPDADGKTLRLNRTKDELKNAPKIDVSKWDEAFRQPGHMAEVYRYYGVKPYFHDEVITRPDGTTARIDRRTDVTKPDVNQPDVVRADPKNRRDTTPGALQQGNNEADLNTTARIRKEVLRRKDLSTSAHNITIVTVDGRVTLRGNVDSEDEKRILGDIAKTAATPTSVENLLEVSTANK